MSNNDDLFYEKITEKKMWNYASPRFGISLFMGFLDFALVYLYVFVYGLDPNLVGTGAMLGKFAIAISQFFFGWISDHTHTRFGRRKPYIFIMTPILAISLFMLTLPTLFLGAAPEETILFTWLIIFNCLIQTSYAMTTVYQSWMPEQFPVDKRPKVSTYQNIFNFLGTAIVVLFSMIVLTGVKQDLEDDPTTIPTILIISIVIFALLMIGLMYWCAIYQPVEKTPEYKTKLIDDLKIILKNKNLILVCLMQGICSFAWAMTSSELLPFTDEVLKIGGNISILVSVIMVLCMILSLLFWKKRIETRGKKKTLIEVFMTAIIVLPFSLLGFFSFSTNLLFAIPFVIMVAISLGGWYLFPYIIYADIAEDDQKKTGELKAGIYSGFPAIILNIFQALSLRFTGWILSLRDIVNVPETDGFSIGLILWGPIASIILIISLIYAKKFIKLDFKWEKKNIE